ncbi:ribose 5-phosphate isomerase B, partial [Colletotrichum cuscutae]
IAITNGLYITVGRDNASFNYKAIISKDLETNLRINIVVNFSPSSIINKIVYIYFALITTEAVTNSKVDRAILIYSTGLGVAILVNKVPGVRVITVHDSFLIKKVVKNNNT